MTTMSMHDELHVKKGDVIFRQGDRGQEMFVISAGRVRLSLGVGGHDKELRVLGPSEFFGELSLLGDAPRSATATALEDCTLLPVARDVFAMLVQDDLDIVFRMMNIQGQRLRDTNQPVEELSRQLGRVRIAAYALRRVGDATLPHSVRVSELASELGLATEVVTPTVTDLVGRGAGTLHDGSWTFDGRPAVAQLVAALCRYADQ